MAAMLLMYASASAESSAVLASWEAVGRALTMATLAATAVKSLVSCMVKVKDRFGVDERKRV
jgi:hypothetical protein